MLSLWPIVICDRLTRFTHEVPRHSRLSCEELDMSALASRVTDRDSKTNFKDFVEVKDVLSLLENLLCIIEVTTKPFPNCKMDINIKKKGW